MIGARAQLMGCSPSTHKVLSLIPWSHTNWSWWHMLITLALGRERQNFQQDKVILTTQWFWGQLRPQRPLSQKIKISNERPFKGALKVLWNNVLGQTRKQGFVVFLPLFPCSENSSSCFKMFGKLSKFSVHKVPSTTNLPVLQIGPEQRDEPKTGR